MDAYPEQQSQAQFFLLLTLDNRWNADVIFIVSLMVDAYHYIYTNKRIFVL